MFILLDQADGRRLEVAGVSVKQVAFLFGDIEGDR